MDQEGTDVTIYFQAGAAIRVLSKALALVLAAQGQMAYSMVAFIGADLLDDLMCMAVELFHEVPNDPPPPSEPNDGP